MKMTFLSFVLVLTAQVSIAQDAGKRIDNSTVDRIDTKQLNRYSCQPGAIPVTGPGYFYCAPFDPLAGVSFTLAPGAAISTAAALAVQSPFRSAVCPPGFTLIIEDGVMMCLPFDPLA